MDKLIFPHSFSRADKDFLIVEFRDLRLSEEQAQEVIYETMARIEMRHPFKSKAKNYCAGLARSAALGRFSLNLGVKIKLRIENPNPGTEFTLKDGARFTQEDNQSVWVFEYNVARRIDGIGSALPKSIFETAISQGKFRPI